MAEPKTKITKVSVDKFIAALKSEQVREDCRTLIDIMSKATKAEPQMWGASIVGFGSALYKYANGREAYFMQVAFSPRKPSIVLYVASDFEGGRQLKAKLGTHKCGKSCIYIKQLVDVHQPTLKKLINGAVRYMIKTHPPKPTA